MICASAFSALRRPACSRWSLPLIVLGLAVGAVNNHVLWREIDQSNDGRFALYPNGSAA
ncbi:MAG: hypothetical protein ACLTBF_01585 [Christensenellales bacterium]